MTSPLESSLWCIPAFPQSPQTLDRVRDRMRVLHYSLRTEDSYVNWIKRFILFHGRRLPVELGASEVEAFLSSLAVDRKVATSTQSAGCAVTL